MIKSYLRLVQQVKQVRAAVLTQRVATLEWAIGSFPFAVTASVTITSENDIVLLEFSVNTARYQAV